MATISKSKNRDRSVSFIAQVRVRPFKPVAKSFADRNAAKTWAEALEKELKAEKDGGAVRPDIATLIVRDLAREYLADEAATSLRSYRSTQERIAWWVNQYGGERVRDLSV